MNSPSTPTRTEQLLLGLRPRPTLNFESFVADSANTATLHALREWLQLSQPGVFFIVGPTGSGRSHLLQAACTDTVGAMYLPLTELKPLDPAPLLDGLEFAPLLCLDDIDAVTTELPWCEALFHCFNRHVGTAPDLAASADVAAGKWLVSAAVAPSQLNCALPDLKSRLSWSGSFGLAPLDDDGRQRMLQRHARERGMDISDEIAQFILLRSPRNTPALITLLERIDRESLRLKQRVSIHLVRKLLSESS